MSGDDWHKVISHAVPEQDWTKWKRRDQWQIDDATTLLLGVDPRSPLGYWIKDHWDADELHIERLMHTRGRERDYLLEDLRPLARSAIDIRDCARTSNRVHALEFSYPDYDSPPVVPRGVGELGLH